MILKLVVLFVLILVGMGLGIVGTVMLDKVIEPWLQRVIIESESQSLQKRLLATLLRWGVILIIVVDMAGVIAKAPILVVRQLAFGITIGVGFSFFFLVGSYLKSDTEGE